MTKQTLSNARVILKLAPDLVDQVLAGTKTVEVAYKQSDSERKRDRLAALSRVNSECAETVANGVMSLDEAERKAEQSEIVAKGEKEILEAAKAIRAERQRPRRRSASNFLGVEKI